VRKSVKLLRVLNCTGVWNCVRRVCKSVELCEKKCEIVESIKLYRSVELCEKSVQKWRIV